MLLMKGPPSFHTKWDFWKRFIAFWETCTASWKSFTESWKSLTAN